MHFFKNSVSFIAVMCVCGAGFAATPRVGMTQASAAAASRRLASLSNVVKSTAVVPTGTSSTSTSSNTTVVLSDTDCIDDYRNCMKGENACGSDFSECTTNVLFHGQMSECFSTLYQCSSTAINSLFGTSNLGNLSSVKKYVEGTNDTEVEHYAYPTDGSIMGLDIIGAATRNKLSTTDCVKKYKKCLNKDNVCGEDFELCTTTEEFKKQAAMCDSTLSRCQKEGFQQLFGDDQKVKPSLRQLGNSVKNDGVINQWMEDGAALAATNAVNTCYKVVDSCFSNACSKNPYSCVEGVSFKTVTAAENIIDSVSAEAAKDGAQTASDVRKFFRAACQDTIGGNQYCYMTFNDGKKPTKADLQDEDFRDDVFSDAYDARKGIITTKVNELLKKFDEDAKNKCIDTFRSCAMRSCGGGSGAACYATVFGKNKQTSATASINGASTYTDIKNGCEAVVNTDANCKYMAATTSGDTYTYSFEDSSAFKTLFPTYKAGNSDSVIVAALNADLSTTYNAAAIEKMQKQCQNVVTNCVRSMCGSNYQNCYRNRSDIYVSTYNTGTGFDKSMNKVGGVLDYTIVQGLCVGTIKAADTCTESLAIAKTKVKGTGKTAASVGWGNATSGTIGAAWSGSAGGISMEAQDEEVTETDEQGRQLCKCTTPQGQNVGVDVCSHEVGGNSDCTEENKITISNFVEKQAVNNLFQEVLADIEAEAQAQYNAKLTKEQNICLAQNSGANPNATFVWAKLASNNGKLPKNYSSHGLGEKGSVASNDLYNSFCRVKITLQSEDRDVQTLLGGGKISVTEYKEALGLDWMAKDKESKLGSGNNESFAYFSTGDSFTCGSWISEDTLNAISAKVGNEARKAAGEGSARDKSIKTWASIGAGLLGAGAGAFAYDKLQTSDSLGGLLNKNLAQSKNGEQCTSYTTQARAKYDAAIKNSDQQAMNDAVKLANQAKAQLANVSTKVKEVVNGATITKTKTYIDNIDIPSYVAYETKKGEGDVIVQGVKGSDAVYGYVSDDVYEVNSLVSDMRTVADYLESCDSALVTTAKNKLTEIENLAKGTPANATAHATTRVRSLFGEAFRPLKHIADKVNDKGYNGKGECVKTKSVDKDAYQLTSTLPAVEEKVATVQLRAGTAKEGVEAVKEVKGDKHEWNQDALNKLNTALNNLEKACAEATSDTTDAGKKSRVVGDVVAGAVGGIATAALASGITSSVQKVKYESAQNEAVKEWMDNIGSKIHCYIGGELVGDFGDIVTVNIDE